MSQQINLYNPLLLKQKKIFSARTMAQALGLIALGLAAVYGYARYQVANLQMETEQAGKRQEAVQARLARISQQFGPRQKSAELEGNIKRAEDEARGLELKLALTSQEDIDDVIKRYQLYIQESVPESLG